jgi:hypothetical protein
MDNFYGHLKNELLARNGALKSLTQQSKVKGDYTEALVRDLIRRLVPQNYKVGHGIVYNSRTGQSSRECDVIVYDVSEAAPLFESQDLVIVDAEFVRIVMQVKNTLDSSSMKDAITNIQAIKRVKRDIMGWIFGFETNVMLRTLYLQAWKSQVIQFIQILESKCKGENPQLLGSQMRFFVEMVRHYTHRFSPVGFQYLAIYDDPRGQGGVHFNQTMTEENVKDQIARIYSLGFWNYMSTVNPNYVGSG